VFASISEVTVVVFKLNYCTFNVWITIQNLDEKQIDHLILTEEHDI